jgi:hypothetical protein
MIVKRTVAESGPAFHAGFAAVAGRSPAIVFRTVGTSGARIAGACRVCAAVYRAATRGPRLACCAVPVPVLFHAP